MAKIGSQLYGDWQLTFQQMSGWFRWLILCAGCAIAVGLIAKLHEYERSLTSPQLGMTLLGLRLLLILIVFLTLLEPVWTWSYEQSTPKQVVVAVDVSESMETRDQHALLTEKLRWGRALGLFNTPDANRRSESWLRALERGEEPEWVTVDEEPNPARRGQRAAARRRDLEASLQEVTEYNRMELVAKVAATKAEPLIEQLQQHVQTEVALFAAEATLSDQAGLAGILQDQIPALNRTRSDLSQALNAALRVDSETPLAGLVLFSDGRDTSKSDPQQLLSRLSNLGVPVFTVLVGSEHRPRDLAIAHVDAPETVFEDDTPLVKAIVNAFGFEDQEITVYLEDLDNPRLAPLQQKIRVNQPALEVAFSLEGQQLGRHRYRVRTDIEEGELRDDNNSREFSISVVDDKAQLLILDGEGRWEFRYLRTAFERDKRVHVDEVVFEQPYLGILDEPFFKSKLSQLPQPAEQSTPFSKYDCVIIGDISPRHLPLAEWRKLERYVRDEGGTIVMTAGKRYFPHAYLGTAVADLLPIDKLRTIDLAGATQTVSPTQRGFRFSITPDGEQLAMFQLGSDLADSRRIWSQLPGHSWGIVGEAKGGATVLAAALQPGDESNLENERRNGLVVQHYVGTGQVLWLGTDSTWRWRFRVGDAYHHRFWGQLIRWTVGFKATAASQQVRLALTRSVINEGESTRLQARWNDRALAQHPRLTTHAVITSIDGGTFRKRVELQRQSELPSMFEADLTQLPPGNFQITLESEALTNPAETPETTLIVREELSEELLDISASRTLLEEMAAVTGGKFYLLDQLDDLQSQFVDSQEETSVREEIPLWSHWIVLLLFSVVATTEWLIRKINGLP